MQALLGTKAKESLDLRAHLKQVKKEDTEKVSVAGPGKGTQRSGCGGNGPGLGPRGGLLEFWGEDSGEESSTGSRGGAQEVQQEDRK